MSDDKSKWENATVAMPGDPDGAKSEELAKGKGRKPKPGLNEDKTIEKIEALNTPGTPTRDEPAPGDTTPYGALPAQYNASEDDKDSDFGAQPAQYGD